MDKRLDSIEFCANYLKTYFLENYEKDQKDNLVLSAVETIIKETKKIRQWKDLKEHPVYLLRGRDS